MFFCVLFRVKLICCCSMMVLKVDWIWAFLGVCKVRVKELGLHALGGLRTSL